MTDIRIDQAQWNSLSETDQGKIIAGLRAAGSLGPKQSIIPHTGATQVADTACAASCTATYEAACAFCAGLGGGAPAAVCYAAAAAAYGTRLALC